MGVCADMTQFEARFEEELPFPPRAAIPGGMTVMGLGDITEWPIPHMAPAGPPWGFVAGFAVDIVMPLSTLADFLLQVGWLIIK